MPVGYPVELHVTFQVGYPSYRTAPAQLRVQVVYAHLPFAIQVAFVAFAVAVDVYVALVTLVAFTFWLLVGYVRLRCVRTFVLFVGCGYARLVTHVHVWFGCARARVWLRVRRVRCVARSAVLHTLVVVWLRLVLFTFVTRCWLVSSVVYILVAVCWLRYVWLRLVGYLLVRLVVDVRFAFVAFVYRSLVG